MTVNAMRIAVNTLGLANVNVNVNVIVRRPKATSPVTAPTGRAALPTFDPGWRCGASADRIT